MAIEHEHVPSFQVLCQQKYGKHAYVILEHLFLYN